MNGPVALFEAESILDEAEAESSIFDEAESILAASGATAVSAASSSFAVEFLSHVEATRRYFNCAPALDRLESIRRLGGFDEYPDAGAAAAELDDAMRALRAFGAATRPRGDASGHVDVEGASVRRALRVPRRLAGTAAALARARSARRRRRRRRGDRRREWRSSRSRNSRTSSRPRDACGGRDGRAEEEDVAGRL